MALCLQPEDLDFLNDNTVYATHGLHPFAAKCAAQLIRWALKQFTEPGECVLDPMSGSGTTLAESRILRRKPCGMDIDPLSHLISKVKSTPIPPLELRKANILLLAAFDRDNGFLNDNKESPLPKDLAEKCRMPSFQRREYWFLPEVSLRLALLKHHIHDIDVPADIRDFYWTVFSSLIIAKTSVANARDIPHSRGHYWTHAEPPNVRDRFAKRLKTMTRMMSDFWKQCGVPLNRETPTQMFEGDARKIPLEGASVDHIFTSPPYCNALDYTRAHTLSVAWLQDVLGTSPAAYTSLGREYIGTERAVKSLFDPQMVDMPEIPLVQQVCSEVGEQDPDKEKVVHKYFADMWIVLGEMGRVLKTGRYLVLVICPSNIRKVPVPTHKVFEQMAERLPLAENHRLEAAACLERSIDDRRRLLPYMKEAFGERMKTEYVMVFQKK